tara:strand:- start:334 stop:591 length:258 start_codon:yes stop_codon:yes gene_type:complete
MESLGPERNQSDNRRQRLHELLIALIHSEGDIELIDADSPDLQRRQSSSPDYDPARWLDRNRRIMNKYQSLVRSAITLDALLDSE